jgi:hypothetical protein
MVNGLRYSVLGVSDVDRGCPLWVSLIACLLLNLLAIRSLQKGYYSRW